MPYIAGQLPTYCVPPAGLQQYEPQITEATEQFSQHANTFVSDVKTGGQKMARKHSASIVSAGMGAVNKLTAPAPTKSD